MGLFSFLKSFKPTLIEETSYSQIMQERKGIFEYMNFGLAVTNEHEKNIEKIIQEEKELDPVLQKENQYRGMTNSEIKETHNEPIFQYEGFMFSDISLAVKSDKMTDPDTVTVYSGNYEIGYIPHQIELKSFAQGKRRIYNLVNGNSGNDEVHALDMELHGGKYKINHDDDDGVETENDNYDVNASIVIKKEENENDTGD